MHTSEPYTHADSLATSGVSHADVHENVERPDSKGTPIFPCGCPQNVRENPLSYRSIHILVLIIILNL